MQDVADDGHRKVFETALVPTDGQHVEHALGWVRVAAVAAVDDRHLRADVLGDEVRGTGVAVADHEHVGGHGFKVAQGIEQGLALASSSKVVRVRVEFSKNTLHTVLPRSSGTFFTARAPTSRNESAVSRISVSSSRGRPSSDRKWRNWP